MLRVRRLPAIVLLIAGLTISLSPLVFPDECDDWTEACCGAIKAAKYVCEEYGSGSSECQTWQEAAGIACATAASKCGNSVSCP